MTHTLQESFHYHLWNGGFYCTPPGRAACALKAARAEVAAKESEDIRIRWEYDPDPDMSWDDDGRARRKIRSGEWDVRGCIVERRCPSCGEWQHASSLWGIVGDGWDDRAYEAYVLLDSGVLDG